MSRAKTNLEDKQRWMRERHGHCASVPGPELVSLDFAQRHYTVTQISEMWGLSADATRKLFENEPGVLVLAGGATSERYTRPCGSRSASWSVFTGGS